MIGQAERVIELQRLKKSSKSAYSNKIITFTSGKGGTGKTFTSVNIASSLAFAGAKVLLIDFDTNLSNINIFLDFHPKTTLYDFLQKKRLFEEVIINYQLGLDIIFGDSGKAEYPELNDKLTDDLMKGINRVEDKYDFILIDTASGAGNGIISLLNKSDINLIITTPEPTAVMDAYVLIKLLKINGDSREKLVVFNKCLTEEAGRIGYDNLLNACRHFLGENVKLLGTIQYNQQVSQSIMDQQLFTTTYKKSITTAELESLSAKILKFKQLANINQALIG